MSLSVEDHHFEKNNLKFTVYLHNTILQKEYHNWFSQYGQTYICRKHTF